MQPTNLSKRQNEQIKELNEKMSADIMELMQKHTLPLEFIHSNFEDWLKLALPHETTKSMGCSYADFKKFWLAMYTKPVAQLNLWEMGFAINCVESKSMAQLKAESPKHYLAIQDVITAMAIRWNEVVNTIKQPVTDRYQKLMEMVRNNKPIIMPDKKLVTNGSC